MRLIDADKLKVEATKQFSYPDAIIALVNTQPTAYDVDKVVERLEKKDFPDYEEEYSCNGQQMVFLYDAIKIVKDGGGINK